MGPTPRTRPRASNSSIKIIAGACCLACSNRSRTRAAPTPTNISINSEPLMEKNATPASPATARAISVLPVPGGPTSNTPLGIWAPNRLYLPGSFKNCTTSTNSSFASSTPATSSNVTPVSFSTNTLALLLPIFIMPPMPCLSANLRNIKNHTRKNTNAGAIHPIKVASGPPETTPL